ncbi:hypothetical protein [Nocardia amamiensis]|uniref:hypothetical protein n=1 Tax=Nocardia TaxID=1817 RepID=UPI00340B6C5D
MTRQEVCSITVSASDLGELILAVHAAAEQPGFGSARRWHYGNVVGIGRPSMRDLAIEAARTRHRAGHPIAALRVVTHHRISVDVVFELNGTRASAQFHCATERSAAAADTATSWAEFLAATTSATLTAADVAARLCRRDANDAE